MLGDGDALQPAGVSRWKTTRAATRFHALYSAASADLLGHLELGGLPAPAVTDVDTRFGTTRCLHWAGQGEPLVLLHGHNGSWLSWGPLLGELAGRDVYALDTVGEPGGSVHTSPITSPSDLTCWLRDTLAALDLQSAVVVGMSYGGWVAAHYAAEYPDAVSALVLLEPSIGAITMKRVLRQGMAVAAAQILPRPLKRIVARRIDAEPLVYDWRLRKPSALAFRKFDRRIPTYAKLNDPTPDTMLASITAPTLLLLGERSELHDVDEIASRARRLIRNVELHIVPGASHALPVTKPAEAAEVIRPFLDAHAIRPAPTTDAPASESS